MSRKFEFPIANLLTEEQINVIEARYLFARGESDLGQLSILAVEAFPSLIASARRKISAGDAQ